MHIFYKSELWAVFFLPSDVTGVLKPAHMAPESQVLATLSSSAFSDTKR